MQCPAIACKARPWQPPNEARDELTRAGSYRWRRWRKGCNVQQTQSENVPWLAAPNVNGHHCMWRGGYSGGEVPPPASPPACAASPLSVCGLFKKKGPSYKFDFD